MNIIQAALASDTPLLLWGVPGVGKTAQIEGLAREAQAHLETLIGSTLDPSDACGYPLPVNGQLHFSAPPWARRLRAAMDEGREAWLFLDELSCASPSVQAALLRVVQGRMVGELDIRGCKILAAANRADHAADGGILSSAVANRWAHLDYQGPTPQEWGNGEASNWGHGPRSQAELSAVSRVSAYLSRHPSALLSPPKNEDDASNPWPSPRSWSAAIRMLAVMGHSPLAENVVASCVGNAAAAEWATWDAARDLPDPEALLGGAPIPKGQRGDQLALTLESVAVASLAIHAAREKRLARAWNLLGSQRPDLIINAAKILRAGAPEHVAEEAERLGLILSAVS